MGIAKVRLRERIVRRREVLLAAARVFIKHGFRLATMEEIAAAAEMAVGTLYHYFTSKEHLFSSILADSAEILSRRLKDAAAKQLAPVIGLVAVQRAYADYFAEYPDYFRLHMLFQDDSSLGTHFPKLRNKMRELSRQSLKLLADKIGEGQKSGFFRADLEPMALATVLWASYNGLFLAATNQLVLDVAGLQVEALLAAAVSLHFSGLRGGAAHPEQLVSVPAGGSAVASLSHLRDVIRSSPWIDPAMIFAGMPALFQPGRAQGIEQCYLFRLTGERGGVWVITVAGARLTVSQGESTPGAIEIEMPARAFVSLVTGEVESSTLWLQGVLKVKGDLQLAARFMSFFALEKGEPKTDRTGEKG